MADRIDMDPVKGLYQKFTVTRTDGSSRKGKKHARCEYFVLDLKHDKFAVPALQAYARACRKEYPELSKDLLEKVDFILLARRGEK